MNAPCCCEEAYIPSLLAAPRMVSATEAARVQPDGTRAPAHDTFIRLLHRLEPDRATPWDKVEGQMNRGRAGGDAFTLDKLYAQKMELVRRHGSDKHHAVVAGINRITLVWPDADTTAPCDCRVFDNRLNRLYQERTPRNDFTPEIAPHMMNT